MDPELIEIRFDGEFPHKNHSYLFLLYEPLIGEQAVRLYELFYALAEAKREILKKELLRLARFSESQFEQAHIKLEKFQLLENHLNRENQVRIFKLHPCKNFQDFLRDDIFARMVIHDLSSAHFELLKDLFIEEDPLEKLEDQTVNLDLQDLETTWSWASESYFQQNRQISGKPNDDGFDWKRFFRGQQRAIPVRLRNRENLNQISRLSDFYGVDELTIRPFILRAMDKKKTQIDFSKVEKDLILSKKGKNGNVQSDPYQASPISFLQSVSAGGQVLPNEKKLLKKIWNDYGFSNEVINTLVEYSMKQCSGQFIDSYIQKTANNWGRIGISSRKEALNWIKNDKPSNSGRRKKAEEVQLPEWYTEVPTQKVSAEVYNETQRLLKMIEEDAQNKQ